MPIFVGTSGWQYQHWRGRYYPRQLAPARWLEHYAADFATVEINASFYRLPPRATFESWAARTPPDFVFAVKLSRYLTHIRRLKEPREPIERFMEAATGLGTHLGPVLVQLPPSFELDTAALDATLEAFPSGTRVAVEPRHASWFVDEVRAVLERHGAALCLADRRGPVTPLWRTADWTYLRFHEGLGGPRPCYRREEITAWARRLAGDWPLEADRFAYFNNDPAGCAVRDAAIAGLVFAEVGLASSRTPPPEAAPVG